MTVENTTRLVRLSGNGATTEWPYTFKIPTSDDLVVSLFLKSTNAETILDPADYSVTGIGTDEGGTVTYPLTGSPVSSLYYLVIKREVALKQELDITNQDGFYPESVEAQLDLMVMQNQQLSETISRSIVTPPSLDPVDYEEFTVALLTAATNSDEVVIVAGLADDIGTLADLDTTLSALGALSTEITTLGALGSQLTTLAAIDTEIGTIAGLDTEITALSALDTELTALGAITANISTVAGLDTELAALGAISADITTVAGIADDVAEIANALAAEAGTILLWPANTAPAGYLELDGSALLISSYGDLDTVLYCGDTNNPTAEWGYRCTDAGDPTNTRSTSGTYIVLPDMRGEFIRGWDNGRGVDSGRSLWAYQDGDVEAHTHSNSAKGGNAYSGDQSKLSSTWGPSTVASVNTASYGGSETRPRNVAAMFIIKY